jgi:hypothetical protein
MAHLPLAWFCLKTDSAPCDARAPDVHWRTNPSRSSMKYEHLWGRFTTHECQDFAGAVGISPSVFRPDCGLSRGMARILVQRSRASGASHKVKTRKRLSVGRKAGCVGKVPNGGRGVYGLRLLVRRRKPAGRQRVDYLLGDTGPYGAQPSGQWPEVGCRSGSGPYKQRCKDCPQLVEINWLRHVPIKPRITSAALVIFLRVPRQGDHMR